MKALVTGGCGFAGSTLCERLARRGDEVHATSRAGGRGNLEESPDVGVLTCDLTDPAAVSRVVHEVRPDAVYHLAARTFVPDAYADGRGFIETNLMGTVNLLGAVREHAPAARVLVVGSAGEYGASGRPGICIEETAPLRPVDPYSASKAAAEIWALQEEAGSDLEVICARPFGHVGPRQEPRFAAPDFARQLGRIRLGEQAPRLEVGNLDAVREFNHVNDIVDGYIAAVERGRSGRSYNMCSGRGLSIRKLLSLLMERSGVEAEVITRDERLRPADIPSLVGDPARARGELGWTAAMPLEETLDTVLQRWGALQSGSRV